MGDIEITEVTPPDGSYGTIGALYTPNVKWHQTADVPETDLTAKFEAWDLSTGVKILESPSLEGVQALPGPCQGYYTWSMYGYKQPNADVKIKCTLYVSRPIDSLPPREVASREWVVHPIQLPPPPEETVVLTIYSAEGGITDPAPGAYYYRKGTSVTITAIPNSGWYFDYWSYDLEWTRANPLTLTLDKSYTVVPHFTTEYTPPPPEGAPPTPTPLPTWVWILIGIAALALMGGAASLYRR